MDTQQNSDPLPQHRSHWRAILFSAIAIISTVIALIWALSDTGHLDEHLGKLALIFFTWLVALLAAWALLRTKE